MHLDLGAGASLGGILNDGLPSFDHGNEISLDVDAHSLFAAQDTDVLGDVAHRLEDAGIDSITVDLNSLFDQDGINSGEVAALNTASTTLHDAGLEMHISDAQAHQVLDAGQEFAAGDGSFITVDAQGTQLSNSLSDLKKLHVDAVAGGDEIDLNLFNPGDTISSLADVLNGNIPTFNASADVTLDLMNSPDALTETSGALYELAQNANMVDALVDSGIDQIAIHESLSLTDDWLDLENIEAIHAQNSGLRVDIKLSGSPLDAGTEYELSKSALSFDDALANEGFEYYLSDDKFGDLIKSLAESGVNDFVVESDNVEITDHLASALIDAGMLQALPAANLILDASSDFNKLDITGEEAARLSTSLNAMANLGVDGIQVGSANQLYVDLQFPTGDLDAMQDISDLLRALDPANSAKPIAFNDQGEAVNISLVLNDETAKLIADQGGFTAEDLVHLSHLGVDQIDVLSESDTETATKSAVEAGLVSADAASAAERVLAAETSSGAPVALPEVKVIGAPDQLHDILDPTKLHH